MSQRWDAVVVGGGHNGLVAARCWRRKASAPRCSKRRPVVGGRR